jgi:hypothetical protein
MLYREIIAVCSEIHTKHITKPNIATFCGRFVEMFSDVSVDDVSWFVPTFRDGISVQSLRVTISVLYINTVSGRKLNYLMLKPRVTPGH